MEKIALVDLFREEIARHDEAMEKRALLGVTKGLLTAGGKALGIGGKTLGLGAKAIPGVADIGIAAYLGRQGIRGARAVVRSMMTPAGRTRSLRREAEVFGKRKRHSLAKATQAGQSAREAETAGGFGGAVLGKVQRGREKFHKYMYKGREARQRKLLGGALASRKNIPRGGGSVATTRVPPTQGPAPKGPAPQGPAQYGPNAPRDFTTTTPGGQGWDLPSRQPRQQAPPPRQQQAPATLRGSSGARSQRNAEGFIDRASRGAREMGRAITGRGRYSQLTPGQRVGRVFRQGSGAGTAVAATGLGLAGAGAGLEVAKAPFRIGRDIAGSVTGKPQYQVVNGHYVRV